MAEVAAAPASNEGSNAEASDTGSDEAVGNEGTGESEGAGERFVAPAEAKAPSGGLSKQLEQLTPKAVPVEAKPEAPTKHKFKFKVDGQESEEEMTMDDIQRDLQKERAWRKRQSEFTADRKKLEDLYNSGKKDPLAAAKELWGVDPMEIAQQRLAEQYQRELERANMKPEERIKAEYEEKLRTEQQRYQDLQQQIDARTQQELETRTFQEIESSFMSALQTEGIPKTPESLAEMAHVAKLALESGYQLSPQQIAQEVSARLEAREARLHESVLTGMDGEALLKRFPAATVKALAKALVARSKAAVAPPPSAPVKKPVQPGAAPTQERQLTPGQLRNRRMGIV